MPYLIRIGKYEYNTSRITCKGYRIYRSKNRIFVEYGSIDVVGRGGGHYYWAGHNHPRIIEYVARTSLEAGQFVRQKVLEQMSARIKSAGYTKLPPGVRIRSFKSNPIRN